MYELIIILILVVHLLLLLLVDLDLHERVLILVADTAAGLVEPSFKYSENFRKKIHQRNQSIPQLSLRGKCFHFSSLVKPVATRP